MARQGVSDGQRSGRQSPRLDHIIEAGGYVSVSTGQAPDGNDILVGKEVADQSMDAAACIGCGACVAACPNASAALFTGAKITHLGVLPQGQPERERRALSMVAQMNAEGFGNCTNIGECTGVCPKEIPLEVIANMNRDYVCASFTRREDFPTPVCFQLLREKDDLRFWSNRVRLPYITSASKSPSGGGALYRTLFLYATCSIETMGCWGLARRETTYTL
jgi:ferredoxin